MSHIDGAQARLIETYRRKAKHYNVTSRLYPVPGYPQQAQRRRAVRALGLRRGDTVVDIACGTGQNFPLIEEAVGPSGRIVGIDLTDAMLAQARHRVDEAGWGNVSLTHVDAAEFTFPARVDAIISTYALSHVRDCREVIARGGAALSAGRRCVVLDLKAPDWAPRWLARPSTSVDDWLTRRPWDVVRAAMQDGLDDLSWTELALGTAFLAVGSRASDNPLA